MRYLAFPDVVMLRDKTLPKYYKTLYIVIGWCYSERVSLFVLSIDGNFEFVPITNWFNRSVHFYIFTFIYPNTLRSELYYIFSSVLSSMSKRIKLSTNLLIHDSSVAVFLTAITRLLQSWIKLLFTSKFILIFSKNFFCYSINWNLNWK